ncbi:MAG: adenylate cyclase regulatory domain-containing protein [Acidimicrobiia bacterium]
MDTADYQRAGLYDPEAENAADRLALLEFLAANGVTLEQMIDADAHGTLAGVASNQNMLMQGKLLSLREVAARADMTLEDADEGWRAVGLGAVAPDEPRFVEGDIATFVNYRLACEVFGREATLQFTRVAASSMARLAEAGMASFVSELERPLSEAQATEVEIARTMQAGSLIAAGVPTVLETFYWHHGRRRSSGSRSHVRALPASTASGSRWASSTSSASRRSPFSSPTRSSAGPSPTLKAAHSTP